MADRIKIESKDLEGNDKIVYVNMPGTKVNREAQMAYNRAFRDAVNSGAILRQKIYIIMKEEGIWDDSKQEQYDKILVDISDKEKQLKAGGIHITEARQIAFAMSDLREEFRALIGERTSMDGNTAEGQADNARFNTLCVLCIVDTKGDQVVKDLEEYDELGLEPYVLEAAGKLAESLYGVDPNYDAGLPENKFLTKYAFADDELRLVNDKGQLIDREGRLVNKDGRFVDEDGGFVNRDGEPIDEEGNLTSIKFAPFLDESGKPIPEPKSESEEEVAEEEEEEKPKTSKPKGRKKKVATAQTPE